MITENWYKFASLSVLIAMVFGGVSLFAIQSIQEMTQLKTQIQALIEENTKLTAQIKALSAQNQALQQQNEANTAALAASHTEIQRLTDENQALHTKITTLTSQLDTLQALNQPVASLHTLLLKLEQQPWLNGVLMTGILIGFPGSCLGCYCLGRPRKQAKTSNQPPRISEKVSQPKNYPKASPPHLNGHAKPSHKPLITPSLN